MEPSGRPLSSPVSGEAWTSLWIVALLSLIAQLALCQFFSFGSAVPLSIDIDPSNLWKYAYQFPPTGEFLVLNWLGIANLPPPLNPFTLAALLPPWWFFTTYTPVMATLALLAMAAFLRELEIPRPAALFGAIVYAWQGDLLTFVMPGHYGYIATWPFFALAAWAALRSQRTGFWAYGLISGACCGIMVGLQPDRGGMASLLIAALYLAAAWKYRPGRARQIANLSLCAGMALIISLAAFLALFQSFIVGVSMGGQKSREETYKFDTQFSLGPEETLTYLAPGLFGWNSNSADGPYWGRIGQTPGWPAKHEGTRNFNLALSTLGTIPTILALLATVLCLPGGLGLALGPRLANERQLYFGRVLLALGTIGLVLSWGYHTPLYRLVFALPLMDKWRDPLKWLELTNFALVTLSALGAQRVLHLVALSNPEALVARRCTKRFLDGMFGLALIVLIASFLLVPTLVAKLQSEDYEAALVPAIIATCHTALFIATLLAAALCALVRLAWEPAGLRNWTLENALLDRLWKAMLRPGGLPLALSGSLALLASLQLAWVAVQFIHPANLALLTASNSLVDKLRSEGNTVRASVSAQDPTLNFLLQNQFNTPEISCLEISAASRLPDAFSTFLENFDDNQSRLWLLAGVKNRVVPQANFAALESDSRVKANIDHVDGYTIAPTVGDNLPSHALVQFRDYLAKATWIPGAEIIPSDAAQLTRMRDPKWDPRATVLLAQPRVEPPLKRPQASPEVNLLTYNSHQIDVQLEARTAGYLLINDAYDHDWEVRMDGRVVPLLRADYFLRAVAVPSGGSTVSMRYTAHYRLAGITLPVEAVNLTCDLALLMAGLVAAIALWRKPRQG